LKGVSSPRPLGDLEERREFPHGIRGEAPAANAFSAYSKRQNASRRKEKLSFSVKFSSMNYNNFVAVQ